MLECTASELDACTRLAVVGLGLVLACTTASELDACTRLAVVGLGLVLACTTASVVPCGSVVDLACRLARRLLRVVFDRDIGVVV